MPKLTNIQNSKIIKSIWLFYAVGLLGFGFSFSRDLFTTLIPVNFAFAFLVLLITDNSDLKKFIPYAIVAFSVMFIIEAISVRTGVIFGVFSFGKSLGPKIFDTPLMIGWNWLMILYCATILARSYTRNRYFVSFLVAVIMVVYDFVLERPAGYLDMWSWSGKFIPMQNFLAWFGISWLLSGSLQLLSPRIKNPVATTLIGVQILFFFLLSIIFYVENGLM